MRNLGVLVCAVAATSVLAAPARGDEAANKKAAVAAPPALVGVTEVARLVPEAGLIDVAIAGDGAGLLAYVVADAASKAEVRVVDVATGAEVRRFDISAFTSQPQRLWIIGRGVKAGVFVVGRPVGADGEATTDGRVVGALFDATGKRAKKTFGPAPIVIVRNPDKPRPTVIVKQVVPGKGGAEVHQVERFDLARGKRLGVKKLTLVGGRDDKLGFTVNHWTADGTVAVGIEDGELVKKNGSRQPDAEGRYDLVDGTKVVTTPIADPMAHARRFALLAREGSAPRFARVSDDLTAVEAWRDDVPTPLTLDQPFALYDPRSLTWAVADDGTLWLGLAVDPWNRPAVDRKKADPEYFDLFRASPDATATRVARILAPRKRFTLGATANRLWLLERNLGFSRGGKALAVYTLP